MLTKQGASLLMFIPLLNLYLQGDRSHHETKQGQCNLNMLNNHACEAMSVEYTL